MNRRRVKNLPARSCLLLCLCVGGLSACKSGRRTSQASAPTASATAQATASVPRHAPPTNSAASPITLFSVAKSAYHVKLNLDGDNIYLLTPDSVFRLAPDHPPEGSRLELGAGAVATSSGFIFWSKSKVWIAPKAGGAPAALAEVAHEPQFFVAAGEKLAWIDRGDDGRYAIRSLRGSKPYTVYSPAGNVDAATMIYDRVVFVERVSPAAWRLGSVRLDGEAPTFAQQRSGRSPAMLVPGPEVYYYDGAVFEVRAISPDLRQERVIASDIICSPLAAADRLYCGQVEGLFEVSLDGVVRLVSPNLRFMSTAIAADRNRVVWVSEAGTDRLEVKLLVRDPVAK
jgi:hypothetical protein